jgi:tripartite-type tricarboxylate transporter receptor subunit TctC
MRMFAALIAVILLSKGAWAQSTSAMKIIVPVPPGAALDVLAHLLADQIGRTRHRTIVIEYRPGANSVIGTEAVARAAPDGNTLLVNAPSAFVVIPHLQKLSFDPLTGFEPICNLVNFPDVIAVNSATPYRTLADLLDSARAKPGDVTLASVGPASLTQIAFEMLKRAAKVDMTFVPYPGIAPAVNALLGGHVTSYWGVYRDVSEQIDAGRLRAITTSSAENRIGTLKELPTIAEAGYKDVTVGAWFGLFAPARTPKETVSQLAEWFSAALQAPEVKERLVAQGLYPLQMCGSDFATYIRKQYEYYGRIIRETNIRTE